MNICARINEISRMFYSKPYLTETGGFMFNSKKLSLTILSLALLSILNVNAAKHPLVTRIIQESKNKDVELTLEQIRTLNAKLEKPAPRTPSPLGPMRTLSSLKLATVGLGSEHIDRELTFPQILALAAIKLAVQSKQTSPLRSTSVLTAE